MSTMYYHATATGQVLCSNELLDAIAFHLHDSQDCIIHSNAATHREALQGREAILLRMTQRRLEAWRMQLC